MKTEIDLDNKTLTIDGVVYEIKKKKSEDAYPEGTIVKDEEDDLGIITRYFKDPDETEYHYFLKLIRVARDTKGNFYSTTNGTATYQRPHHRLRHVKLADIK